MASTSKISSIDEYVANLKKIANRMDAPYNLMELCKKFITDNNITCSETVYQTDRVIENAYDFIAKICEIVGYVKSE